jgi:hypothetical protein
MMKPLHAQYSDIITPLEVSRSRPEELARVPGEAQYRLCKGAECPGRKEAAMALREAAIAASMLLLSSSTDHARAQHDWRVSGAPQEPHSPSAPEVMVTGRVSPNAAGISSDGQVETVDRWHDFPMTVRPGTLAEFVDSLAGGPVRLTNARVVGVFDVRVFLVESQTRLPPLMDRNRVLVFVEAGALRVDPAVLVASTVTVSGVARTLLGMKTSREVPWPKAVTPEVAKRLEIRAAVLATSVRTPEGIDLLVRGSTSVAPGAPSSSGR